MAKLQSSDQLIVDRGSSTYKTSFTDLESSINHDFRAEVDQTIGGTILETDITGGGTKFLVNINYQAIVSGSSDFINFVVKSVGDNGELLDIAIEGNSPSSVGLVYVAKPIKSEGSIASASFASNATPPTIADNTSQKYIVRQTVNGVLQNSGIVQYSHSTTEGDKLEVTNRGALYASGVPAYLEILDINGDAADGPEIVIEVIDPDHLDPEFEDAEITVISVADGVDTDNAKITVEIAGNEKDIYLVPGPGIAFSQLPDLNGVNQLQITNTLTSLDDTNDSNTVTSSYVIVDEYEPTVDAYPIKDGSLWFNLLDARLYIAVTYLNQVTLSTEFEWIDASPSSFNDSLRKNKDDSTDYKIDVNNSLYATHFDLERLPLIS